MQLKTRVILSFLIIFCVVSSCKRLVEPPPVSMDKMKMVLLDLQLSETYSVGLNHDTLRPANRFKKNQDSLTLFYASVLHHYNMTNVEFKNAMKWYEMNPPMMDSLISMTIEQLTKEQAKLNIKDYEPVNSEGRVDPQVIKRQLMINTDKMQSKMDSLNSRKLREEAHKLKKN